MRTPSWWTLIPPRFDLKKLRNKLQVRHAYFFPSYFVMKLGGVMKKTFIVECVVWLIFLKNNLYLHELIRNSINFLTFSNCKDSCFRFIRKSVMNEINPPQTKQVGMRMKYKIFDQTKNRLQIKQKWWLLSVIWFLCIVFPFDLNDFNRAMFEFFIFCITTSILVNVSM